MRQIARVMSINFFVSMVNLLCVSDALVLTNIEASFTVLF